jgi:type IV secretory pathway VirB4 component
MLRLSATNLTTRHSAGLYPLGHHPPFPTEGPAIGVDHLSGGPFCFDPFILYQYGLITSPNMVILGSLGVGKSALVKTLLARQHLWGRQVLVIDPKGEYQPLAEHLNLPTVRLEPAGRVRINPLDTGGSRQTDTVGRRRAELVTALAEAGLGRAAHAEERAAIAAVTAGLRANATLPGVVDALLHPDQDTAATLATTPAALADAVRPAALELRRLVHGDLRGMFDTPTNLPTHIGTGMVLDVSAVFDTPALPAVMTCALAWMKDTLAQGQQTVLVLDEAWAVLRLLTVTRWLQTASKLSRTLGLSVIAITHRLSDLVAQGDDGSQQAKQAIALVADTQTQILYRQPATEHPALEHLGLNQPERSLVTALPAHRALWRVGTRRALVEHLLSPADTQLVDTDAAMRQRTSDQLSTPTPTKTISPSHRTLRTARTTRHRQGAPR